MADYPETIVQFRRWFAHEADCRNYLIRLRWPHGVCCPRCENHKLRIRQPSLYWCASCRYAFTVTSGTLFADTRKPLRLWFEVVWNLANQRTGTSAVEVQNTLRLGSYETAWAWLHKLRRAMASSGRDQLSGVVEVTEASIGSSQPPSSPGSAGASLILVAAQAAGQKAGRIRLTRLADNSAASLEFAVLEAIRPGARVLTNPLQGYHRLRGLGYDHETVGAPGEPNVPALPRATQVASLLKRWLHLTHQDAVRPAHIEYYLDEFSFRFNRWKSVSPGLRFRRLLHGAVTTAPVPYKHLIGTACGETRARNASD